MDRVLKRRLWLAAGAVVAGVVLGLALNQYNTKRAVGFARSQTVSVVVLGQNEASPLGEASVVTRENPTGRLLMAAPGGPQDIAVIEPAPDVDVSQAMTSRMFDLVKDYPSLKTIYIARPKKAAPQKAP